MSVASVLPGLHRLADLPRLVAALGHEPRFEEAPPGAWGAPGRVAVVGASGGFLWYGVEAREPERAALGLARRLRNRGRPAGVLALDPQARHLAAAVAFAELPVLRCSLAAPERLALACLDRLAGPATATGGPLAYAARAAEALEGEGVGRRFFRAFRATLDRMTAALPGPSPEAARHALALLQLTRVLFLYFVQSKGWLDGRADFLARAVDGCLAGRRHLHRDLLAPLFFGTLNRPPEARSRVPRRFGRVPFLNGGLFEPHALERRRRPDLPNDIWRDAFDSLFERFHFTVDERGRPGLIAPDMLGRVFEGVMEPAARRRSGTFYTPAPLVHALLRAALAAWLAPRAGCSEERAERLLDDRDPATERALRRLTILDPAVGSGAFLLGALDVLAGQRGSRARRGILRRSLYGVDLSAAAVRLTELRLWLAVIADDRSESPEQVKPLPNLDALVRQGDSLLDRFGAPLPIRDSPLTARLARVRHELVAASGTRKRSLARELRRTEVAILAASLATAEDAVGRRIADCLADARGRTLFGSPRGLDVPLRRELSRLRAERLALRLTRRKLTHDGELPWFHCESHFADVFAAGGFDLVVGNPPWVRAEQVPPEQRLRLAARYRWWRAGGRGFAHRPDLSLAFVERAYEIVRARGVVAMLVPAKLATAGYGARARHALAAEATLHAVADLESERHAFDATAYPMALVLSRQRPDQGHLVRGALSVREPAVTPQRALGAGGPWVVTGGAARDALLGAGAPRLRDRFTPRLGVKTGANALFLDPPASVEAALVRVAVRGRDVRPFAAVRGPRLLWPCDGAGHALAELPPGARAHLALGESRLRARADYQTGPPWTLFRTGPASAPHRVVWADLARRLTALALTGADGRSRIPLNSCYVLVAPDAEAAHRLAAWLNCTWIRAAARLGATVASGGYARFGAAPVGSLPLPDAAVADPALGEL
ncbi:MAG: Eco57I restriction-modification methylase domain-containing protein, partial [Gemmatimonadales bacterium]